MPLEFFSELLHNQPIHVKCFTVENIMKIIVQLFIEQFIVQLGS